MNVCKQYHLKAIFFSVFLSSIIVGCGKETAGVKTTSSGATNVEVPGTVPRKIKSLKLGEAGDFSILAYASISSVPNSNIDGKVGLMPGTRDQISIDPREVAGGAGDIMGNDDDTVPMNLLSNAKVDMVLAYRSAVELAGDKDKVGIYNGDIDGKILFPGVYEWKENMTISENFRVYGSESDIWIFKIQGHLKVMPDVRMILGEGVKPGNIFWQVAGSVVLESQSNFAGTIIAQPSIEMKQHAVLTGRAFCKNGFVKLNQATIRMP